MEKLLKIRRIIKKRKPVYLRQQYGYFSRLSKEPKWRKPRGIHSKILMRRKGHRRMPEVGYGSPKKVRGLNRDGLREILVSNTSDLALIDKKTEIVVIRSSVGKKKRLEILKEAKKLGLKVANYKDIDKAITEIESVFKKTKKVENKKKEEINKDKKEGSKKEVKKEKKKGDEK